VIVFVMCGTLDDTSINKTSAEVWVTLGHKGVWVTREQRQQPCNCLPPKSAVWQHTPTQVTLHQNPRKLPTALTALLRKYSNAQHSQQNVHLPA
jgi:hypothetical protein